MPKNNTNLIRYLHKLDPRCYWCGKHTTPGKGTYRNGCLILAGDAATLDHYYSKLEIERLPYPPGTCPRVLACNYCNHVRHQIVDATIRGVRDSLPNRIKLGIFKDWVPNVVPSFPKARARRAAVSSVEYERRALLSCLPFGATLKTRAQEERTSSPALSEAS